MQPATAIYQNNLDAVSEALWNRDVKTIMEHLAMPNSMVTHDATFIISSIDEMAILVTEFRDHMASIGADKYERICLSARYLSARNDLIIGIHETRISKGGTVIGAPYLCRMTLINRDGNWQGVLIEYEISNAHIKILSPDLVESQMQALARIGTSFGRG